MGFERPVVRRIYLPDVEIADQRRRDLGDLHPGQILPGAGVVTGAELGWVLRVNSCTIQGMGT